TEAVGVVIAVGPGLTDRQVGDVVAYTLNPMGSYAEEQILPSDRVVPVPSSIEPSVAASVFLKGMTAQFLVRRCFKIAKRFEPLRLLDKQSISNTEPMEDEEIAKRFGFGHMEPMDEEETAKRLKAVETLKLHHMVWIRNRLKTVDKQSISSMMLAHMILVYNRMWLIGIYLRLVLNCTRLVDKQSREKIKAHPCNEVGLLGMGMIEGACFVRPTRDLDDIRFALKGLMYTGQPCIPIGHALSFFTNSQLPKRRLLVFSGGRLSMDSVRLQFYAKRLKEFKVAVDVVNFGMQFLPKTKKKLLQEFVETADNHGNSHYLYAPSGSRTSLGQQILRSPIAPECLPMQEEKKKKEEVERGHTILVHAAAGGVGSLLCQWANVLGATVIGTVSTKEKAAQAKEDGCHHVIVTKEETFVERVTEITSGKGVEVVYDSVRKDTFE
ncbi:GroES-like zinc-binding alcohol dehydrogenase family protein, partial [Tanacetum coccineum]